MRLVFRMILWTNWLPLTSNNWGWSNGPFNPFTSQETLLFYIDARNCQIEKGTCAGSVVLTYSLSGKVTIDYNMLFGFKLVTTNLYVGKQRLPKNSNGKYTTAPGQFPYDQSKSQYKGSGIYEIQITEKPLPAIYVVAHGDVEH